jgi:rieske iron-sulfur protein
MCGTAATLVGALGLGRAANAATTDARKLAAQSDDELVFPSWENDGRLLTPADVVVGAAPLLVYPRDPHSQVIRERSRLNQILVMRFELSDLDARQLAMSAAGILAYSGLCTHTACGVSEWDSEKRHLLCPCHGSEFDPLKSGARISGPAPRSLPALPVTLRDERIVIAGAFTSKVGANA